jgi:hypothetical protein
LDHWDRRDKARARSEEMQISLKQMAVIAQVETPTPT